MPPDGQAHPNRPTARALDRSTNIVLIGMPAVGKSTVGVLLAKATGRDFVDTDVLLQARLGRRLQEVIDAQGLEAFCQIEEQAILELALAACVVATGGSAVYSPAAMAHLADGGVIVHLEEELDVLQRRLHDLRTRGVVIARDQDLHDLYRSRQPLYARCAQVTLRCNGRTQDQVAAAVLSALGLG
ncbi:MAG: shikimate kinase [Phycisphaerae bacterium]|nr:shikimate kinase [Phycisphaerae bacterium]